MKYIIILCFLLTSPNVFSQKTDTLKTEEEPVPLNLSSVMKQVRYPGEAKEEGIEGKVLIEILVNEEGDVEKTGKITGPIIFYTEVLNIVSELKFTPGKVNGYPAKVWVRLPFNFIIK